MSFTKLPANSRKLLLELVQADNPTQMLCTRFDKSSQKESEALRGILRKLREEGYINIDWAGNRPYRVVLNNSARTYEEQRAEYEAQYQIFFTQRDGVSPIIFISHRSTDKEVADMMVDFFSATGIPRESVFCSSLPGNDINEKISGEVKTALKNSAINIAILSSDYYQSAYCLNEAGILWYQDAPVIPIALPEINPDNMYGFLNSEYKLRRLDSATDIAYVYDAVCEAVSAPPPRVSLITYESDKLKSRYGDFLQRRGTRKTAPADPPSGNDLEITTDDERIVLYCILQKNVRKISKEDVIKWLHENEIHDVNVDNAFDLLSSINGCSMKLDTLEFGIETFRKYSSNASQMMSELEGYVDQHKKLAAETFVSMWKAESFDSLMKLFLAYIVDEKVESFGARWMADEQIKSIMQWEDKYFLDETLSKNYGSCLQTLIQKELVYESSWTSYGNPREYTLYTSMKKLLFNCPAEILDELIKEKGEHLQEELPF